MLQLFTWIWWLQYFIYICADYLYSEIDGNLKGTEIKFTIQIKQSYGIILYGIDVWNDSLLINIREVNNNNIELIFNINENEGKDNIMSLCNCSKCFDESFYFEFDFSDINDSKQSIQIKCNRKISKLLMQHNSKGAVEYAFVDEAGYPYLETTLNQPSSNNILEAIEMTVHLSRFNGLLLYYIDNNYNQLITTLQDSKPPTMKVEFRGEQYTIAVDILCHCKIYSCLYENLVFSFQVTNTVNIKCNNGSVNRHSFWEKRDVKQDYPIPDFDKHIYAYLWFINVPQVTSRFGKVYPNPDYLTGCIKSVTYNGATVNLNPVGMNRTCETKCQPKRCNDGKCLETYDHEVKCICNDTFLNGEFCDKSLSLLGQWNFTFHFKIIKLSWKFPNKNPTKVFSLNNKASSIEVIINNSTELLFQFIHSNLTFGSIITKNYSVCNNNIMTITFDDKNIIVKFKHNNIWETSNIFINFMLYKVEFDKVTFGEKNVKNAGDCVYKLAEDEIEWLPMKPKKLFRGANMNKLLDGPEMNNRKDSNNCNPSNESSKVLENSSWYFNTDLKIIIVIGCIDAILLIIFAWLFADYKRCRSILYLNHTRNQKS